MKETRHFTDVFERLPFEKKERILEAAVKEFAYKGFSTANINIIAKNAKISIGAMYKYFLSKDDLFLTVVDRAYSVLERVLDDIQASGGDILVKIELMIRAAQKYSKMYPELNQIYLDMTSEGLAPLTKRISGKLESITARLYRKMLIEAQASGLIDASIDAAITALCLDNLILTLQFSYTSQYYQERMKVFLGPELADDDEAVANGIMRFIRGALKA
ncbi:MAG: TetR/AcrR family transcriptional regulator [Desulfobacteraceae bacterium]|nr:TetR/AcrR family transcriptional regulator [Desulfobacteraceae bacterium]